MKFRVPVNWNSGLGEVLLAGRTSGDDTEEAKIELLKKTARQ